MRKYLLQILLITISISHGQNQDYIVDHISVKEGLYHNYVSKIVSDSLNIKWIATENGINKYDGLKFSVIEPNERYSELKNENIETLFIDSKNNLWIGTKSGGLSKLDIKTNILTNYNYILNTNFRETLRIREIAEDINGNIWVGSHENGLYVIDDQEKKIIKHFNNIRVKNILLDKEGNIWIATQNTLNKYNASYDRLNSVVFDNYISKIVLDESRKRVWLNTVNDNRNNKLDLYYVEMTSNKISHITTNIIANYASSLFLDRHNKLWVGTWGYGLYQSNDGVTNFNKIELVDPYEKNKTSYDIILDIHSDLNNIIWISSNYGGIVKLTESKGFKNLDKVFKRSEKEDNLNIHAIYKDTDGIYIGTLKNGLWFGKDLSMIKQIFSSQEGKIHAISKHHDYLVFGSGTNTVFLNKNKKEVARLDISKSNCFFSESEYIIWIGTQKNGLYKLDISNIKSPKILKHFSTLDDNNKIESNRITSLTYDAFGNMWMGSYNGLHLYDKETEKFVHYSKLLKKHMPKIINCVYADGQNIWAGTPNGLYKLNYINNIFKIIDVFTVEDGLKNDFINGIVSDSHNNLWITNTTNLVKFDQFNNAFVNYGKDDGVFTTFFNLRTIHASDNGSHIFVGGTDNLTFFETEKIKNQLNPKKLIFTHLKIDNRNIQAHDSVNGKYFLKKNFNYVKELEFTHKEKSFSIGFINNDFTDLTTTNYRYKLVGYEDEWNYLENQKEVNFIGLPPGKYDLQVASSKDFVNWTDSNSIKIKVKYPPLSSPLAYFIYGLILFAIVSVFLNIFFKHKFLRNKLVLSQIATDKEHDLNEAKLTFFTNISHEFRTPLTLILGPIRELISSKELQPEITEKVLIVEKNANRLLNLTNQLLDFRKAEHGLLKLSASNGNFARFCNEVFMYFKEQANSKKIIYNYNSSEDSIVFPFDRNKMEIVICNLISNALNHTNKGGKIELKLSTDENNCLIHIIDSGIGIEQEELDKIFDRFYQIKNTKTAQVIGSGIGLSFSKKIIELHNGTIEVKSKPKKGTIFTVKLPFPEEEINASAKKEQLINSENIDNYIKLKTETGSLNASKESQKNTILIVDDNDDIRHYIRSLLQDEYNIIEAVDGEEGISFATDKMPDLILCDIMMPKKDGLTACKELKTQVSTSHIPIIMLTARSSNMYEIEGLKTGADDFISKPFDPQIIKARISSALQNRLKLRDHFLNLVRFEPTTTEDEVLDPERIFINKVINMVEENLLDPTFGIETLMNEFFMSQSTLYRKIKSLTGLSLTVFIRSIRLKKSAEIILTEDIKLSHVAMKVGFNDYKYFRESFVKQFGCLPSEYRNSFNKV